MSQFFTSGDQNIGVAASALVLPMNTQDHRARCKSTEKDRIYVDPTGKRTSPVFVTSSPPALEVPWLPPLQNPMVQTL